MEIPHITGNKLKLFRTQQKGSVAGILRVKRSGGKRSWRERRGLIMEGLISTGEELGLFCMWQEATGGSSTGRKIRQWGWGWGG